MFYLLALRERLSPVWSGLLSRQADGESTRLVIGPVRPVIRAGRRLGNPSRPLLLTSYVFMHVCVCKCVYAKAKQTYGLYTARWSFGDVKTRLWFDLFRLHLWKPLILYEGVSRKTLRALWTSFRVPPLLQCRQTYGEGDSWQSDWNGIVTLSLELVNNYKQWKALSCGSLHRWKVFPRWWELAAGKGSSPSSVRIVENEASRFFGYHKQLGSIRSMSLRCLQ